MNKVLFSYLLLIGVCLLTTWGCKKDLSHSQQEEKGEVFIHLTIPTLKQSLRGEEASDPMRRIESLHLLFFSGEEDTSELVEIRELNQSQVTSNRDRLLVKLPYREEYRLLCIANASSDVQKLFYKGCRAEVFISKEYPIASRRMTSRLSTEQVNGAFMMTNAGGFVVVNESNYLKNEQEAEQVRPVEVLLEAIAARVLLVGNSPEMGNSLLQMKSGAKPMYAVTGVSKSIYWVRHTTTSLPTSPEVEALEEEYAYSPGYETIAGSLETASYPQLITSYRAFFTSMEMLFPNLVEIPSSAPNLEQSSLYCKETTIDPEHFLTGFVPHIIVAYPLHPATLQVGSDKGWIAFRGKYLTEEAFTDYVVALRRNPSTPLPEGMPAEFATAVEKIKDNERVLRMDQPFSLEGIDFYWKSLNFYACPLRHFDNSKAPNANSFGRYGIVRNNEYTVRVQKIAWFGSNTMPELNRSYSPIAEKSSIKLSIQVKDISKREQNIEL